MSISASDLQETISLLTNERPEVVSAAAQVVRVMTADPATLAQLVEARKEAVAGLLAAAQRSDSEARPLPLEALINLGQEGEAVEEMVQQKAVGTALGLLPAQGKSSQVEGLLVNLLANLTTSEAGCKDMLATNGESSRSWEVLPERALAEPSTSGQDDFPDPYREVGSILTNITRDPAARLALLDGSSGSAYLAGAAGQLRSRCVARRRGCATTIRNLAFKAEEDGTLEKLISLSEMWAQVLESLSGSEGEKEADAGIRAALAESVFFLAQSSTGMKALWELGGPEKLRKGYEMEEDPDVCQAMERTAELFLEGGDAIEEFEA